MGASVSPPARALPTALATYTWLLRARSPAFSVMLQSEATARRFGAAGGVLGPGSPLAMQHLVLPSEVARVVQRQALDSGCPTASPVPAQGDDPVFSPRSPAAAGHASSPLQAAAVFAEAMRGRYALHGAHVHPRVGIALLHYLTTDTLPPALSPQDGMSLMLLAVEFSVPRLARLVEAQLIRLLDADNVIGLLNFADTFSGQGASSSSAEAGDGVQVSLCAFADPRMYGFEQDAAARASGTATVLRASIGSLPFAGLRAACLGVMLRLWPVLGASPDLAALSPALRQELEDLRASGRHVYSTASA